MIDVINHVPFGADNALTAQAIWRRMDCWAETGVRGALNELAVSGAIKRRKMGIPAGFQWVYWRE